MFKNLKTHHWLLIAVGAYLLYRWYKQRNNAAALIPFATSNISNTPADNISVLETGTGDRSVTLLKNETLTPINANGTRLFVK